MRLRSLGVVCLLFLSGCIGQGTDPCPTKGRDSPYLVYGGAYFADGSPAKGARVEFDFTADEMRETMISQHDGCHEFRFEPPRPGTCSLSAAIEERESPPTTLYCSGQHKVNLTIW